MSSISLFVEIISGVVGVLAICFTIAHYSNKTGERMGVLSQKVDDYISRCSENFENINDKLDEHEDYLIDHEKRITKLEVR